MGCGAMGLGVAQVCAQVGIPTVAVKATPGSTDKIRSGLEKSLAKMVEMCIRDRSTRWHRHGFGFRLAGAAGSGEDFR